MKANRFLHCFIALALLPAMLLALSGCGRHKINHLRFTDDFPGMYETELHQIFGDYVLGERTDRHIEGEDCDCGYYEDTVDCWEWEISYTDALGNPMHCTLSNRESLYAQQVAWLQDQIEAHLFSTYVERDFGDILDESGSYCYCKVGYVCLGATGGDQEEEANVQTGRDYLEALKKNEQPIPLSSTGYPELFDRYPMSVSINVRLPEDNSNQAAQRYEAAVELLDTMTGQIAEEIGPDLNMDATVYKDLDFNDTIYFMRGEKTQTDDPVEFWQDVFRSYKGKFW